MIYTGTTPTYTLTFSEVDLTQAVKVVVTISGRDHKTLLELTDTDLTITQTIDDNNNVTGSTVEFTLTQAQTLVFTQGYLEMQVNWKPTASTRACSEIVGISYRTNLKQEVM